MFTISGSRVQNEKGKKNHKHMVISWIITYFVLKLNLIILLKK